MARPEGLRSRLGRRLFGATDSWRRIALTGVVGGLVVAVGVALVTGLLRGERGSLDFETPTAVAPAAGPVGEPPVDVAPGDVVPVEEPTATPPPETALATATAPPATPTPPATELPVEPSATPTATSVPQQREPTVVKKKAP